MNIALFVLISVAVASPASSDGENESGKPSPQSSSSDLPSLPTTPQSQSPFSDRGDKGERNPVPVINRGRDSRMIPASLVAAYSHNGMGIRKSLSADDLEEAGRIAQRNIDSNRRSSSQEREPSAASAKPSSKPTFFSSFSGLFHKRTSAPNTSEPSPQPSLTSSGVYGTVSSGLYGSSPQGPESLRSSPSSTSPNASGPSSPTSSQGSRALVPKAWPSPAKPLLASLESRKRNFQRLLKRALEKVPYPLENSDDMQSLCQYIEEVDRKGCNKEAYLLVKAAIELRCEQPEWIVALRTTRLLISPSWSAMQEYLNAQEPSISGKVRAHQFDFVHRLHIGSESCQQSYCNIKHVLEQLRDLFGSYQTLHQLHPCSNDPAELTAGANRAYIEFQIAHLRLLGAVDVEIDRLKLIAHVDLLDNSIDAVDQRKYSTELAGIDDLDLLRAAINDPGHYRQLALHEYALDICQVYANSLAILGKVHQVHLEAIHAFTKYLKAVDQQHISCVRHGGIHWEGGEMLIDLPVARRDVREAVELSAMMLRTWPPVLPLRITEAVLSVHKATNGHTEYFSALKRLTRSFQQDKLTDQQRIDVEKAIATECMMLAIANRPDARALLTLKPVWETLLPWLNAFYALREERQRLLDSLDASLHYHLLSYLTPPPEESGSVQVGSLSWLYSKLDVLHERVGSFVVLTESRKAILAKHAVQPSHERNLGAWALSTECDPAGLDVKIGECGERLLQRLLMTQPDSALQKLQAIKFNSSQRKRSLSDLLRAYRKKYDFYLWLKEVLAIHRDDMLELIKGTSTVSGTSKVASWKDSRHCSCPDFAQLQLFIDSLRCIPIPSESEHLLSILSERNSPHGFLRHMEISLQRKRSSILDACRDTVLKEALSLLGLQ